MYAKNGTFKFAGHNSFIHVCITDTFFRYSTRPPKSKRDASGVLCTTLDFVFLSHRTRAYKPRRYDVIGNGQRTWSCSTSGRLVADTAACRQWRVKPLLVPHDTWLSSGRVPSGTYAGCGRFVRHRHRPRTVPRLMDRRRSTFGRPKATWPPVDADSTRPASGIACFRRDVSYHGADLRSRVARLKFVHATTVERQWRGHRIRFWIPTYF